MSKKKTAEFVMNAADQEDDQITVFPALTEQQIETLAHARMLLAALRRQSAMRYTVDDLRFILFLSDDNIDDAAAARIETLATGIGVTPTS